MLGYCREFSVAARRDNGTKGAMDWLRAAVGAKQSCAGKRSRFQIVANPLERLSQVLVDSNACRHVSSTLLKLDSFDWTVLTQTNRVQTRPARPAMSDKPGTEPFKRASKRANSAFLRLILLLMLFWREIRSGALEIRRIRHNPSSCNEQCRAVRQRRTASYRCDIIFADAAHPGCNGGNVQACPSPLRLGSAPFLFSSRQPVPNACA